ncbi:ribosomal protein subunit S24 [Schizosaccharomyces cryophilus OY26]|uniref:Ribosomal protein subunit S24 n=1 Tax=Schizosaccharomyces cryophilus (strain OY26 / ATCC MYA-4695 / CBS 11777 / NBRC 106824 / NRRL Y48691) TaxID=653667 RepID=S9W6K0_SCHCR|nr:ribosomal protein subunit S24 [Schizosaccharomyces cryophilus OY26]EPY54159.1 ribosomal protein subunit S24 [Schizosaccharomyces cryophilus OY26]
MLKNYFIKRRLFSTTAFTRFQFSKIVSEPPSSFEPRDNAFMNELEKEMHQSNVSLNLMLEHSKVRQYYRKAAYELPSLTMYAEPYQQRNANQVLTFESPIQMSSTATPISKVVLKFSVENLPNLEQNERHVLKLLAGARYNPETDQVKMSCNKYPSSLQNKLFLAETLNTLVSESKRLKAKFADIPLDTRHIKMKKHEKRFPKHWLEQYQQMSTKKEQ